MKKEVLIIFGLLLLFNVASAQKYFTKNGMIKFYSDAPMEKIEAVNKQVNAAIEVSKGDMIFKVLMKSFEFEKQLMQEHFNENYVESDKFPDAKFKGMISNLKDINFNKDGIYNAEVEGELNIHGVAKKIKEKGTIEVKDGKLFAKSKFNIFVKDYNIKIPKTVVNNLSESVQITIDLVLNKL